MVENLCSNALKKFDGSIGVDERFNKDTLRDTALVSLEIWEVSDED